MSNTENNEDYGHYIYAIYKKSREEVPLYIGSTHDICRRIANHKNKSSSEYSGGELNQYVLENGGFENFDFTIVNTTDTREEALVEEQNLIDFYGLDNLLNERNSVAAAPQNLSIASVERRNATARRHGRWKSAKKWLAKSFQL